VAVRSQREAEHALEDQQQVLAERLLEALAVHLTAAPSRVPDDARLLERQQDFRRALDVALGAVPSVLEQLADGPQADEAAWAAVDELQRSLSALARTRLRRTEPLARIGDLRSLREALSDLHPGEEPELERAVLFFDMWADRRSAIRALDEGGTLVDAARRLEELLAAAGEELSPEAQAQVDAALAEVRQATDETADAVGQLARAAGGGPSPLEQAAASQAVKDLARRLEDALSRGDQAAARRLAGELAEAAGDLAGMAASLADPATQGDPELSAAVHEMRRQLERIVARQADLRDRTNELRESAQQGMAGEDRQRIEELFRELLALADEAVALEERGESALGGSPALTEHFARLEERTAVGLDLHRLETELARRQAGPTREERQRHDRLKARLMELMVADLLGGDDVEVLMRLAEQARENLGRLRQSLADRDIEGARRGARFALGRLEVLAEELGRALNGRFAEHAPPFQDAAARVAEILSRLDELERQVRAAVDRAMTGVQRGQLGGLGAEQLGLERAARDVAARLRELGADAPFLGSEVGQAVDEAAGHMRSSTNELAEGRAGESSEEQGEAHARLDDAQRSLSSRGRGGGRGHSRRADGRRGILVGEEVEIPDADAYRVPRAFREEILEAMRETPAPAGYEQQVREYYRRLVE
jgi:hypothetical protein